MVKRIFRYMPQKVKLLRVFFPQELNLEPETVKDIAIDQHVQRTLSVLCGNDLNGSHIVDVSLDNALKVQTYGTGFRTYTTDSGTAPDSYNGTNGLFLSQGFHRYDMLIENDEALIQFRSLDGVTWGDDIPLTAGYHSINFSGSGVRIKKRNTTAPAYYITAYR